MQLVIQVERVSGDRTGDDFVASFRRPSGEEVGATVKPVVSTNIPLAIGLLLAVNRQRISDEGSELRQLIETSMTMGVPGLTGLGEGVVHRLPWTRRLMRKKKFQWPDFSVDSEVTQSLTSSRHYAQRSLQVILREQKTFWSGARNLCSKRR